MTEDTLLIMVAPNGARKQKSDHPALPVSIDEVVAEARNCYAAGAAMLHAHIRDSEHQHSLDSGHYRELIAAMAEALPEMLCQITTEQAGRFTPADQARCLKDVAPQYASVSIREITGDQSERDIEFGSDTLKAAADNGTHLQYILYGLDDLELLRQLHDQNQLPDAAVDVLYVLGRYHPDQRSTPEDLDPFLKADQSFIRHWMVCAFGPREYDIMSKVAAHQGQARIGFENNLWLKDGSLAPSNAALVEQLANRYAPVDSQAAKNLFS